MGVTGSGKSKFIECASGLEEVGVGDSYESCRWSYSLTTKNFSNLI